MRFLQFSGIQAIVLFTLLGLPNQAFPTILDQRPHWAEKSSFIVGGELYAVGVASRVTTIEEGRQRAFEHGISEIMNFAQITDLSSLVIETQMIYEMPNPDRTITVYRLLKVPLKKLLETKNETIHDDWTSPSPRMKRALKRLRTLRE